MLENDCPYPGLRPFDETEAHLFFGRDSHTDRLLEILARQRFLAVIGPSGSGKSSLVRAGLLPALPLGAVGTGNTWRRVVFRPGNRPLAQMARALLSPGALGQELRSGAAESHTEADLSDLAHVEAELRRGPLGLIDLIRDARLNAAQGSKSAADGDPDFNLLVLVDQFEELFTYADADPQAADESEAFVNLLLRSREPESGRIFVVITMRTDFLGNCVRFLDLPDAINRAQYLTPRMSRDQIALAVRDPARHFGGDVAPELVAELANAVQIDQDELPLLQHALARMWRLAVGKRGPAPTLVLDDLASVGGITGALPQHAEEVFASLGIDDRGRCEWLFRAITEQRGIETGGQRVRRPRALEIVGAWAGQDWQAFEPVLLAFGHQHAGFLNYKGQPGIPAHGAATVVDVVHEALIRRWARLQSWTDAEARASRLFLTLIERSRQERDGEASPLDGADLGRASQWRSEGLACDFAAPLVEARGAPIAPSPAWAVRYESASSGEAFVGVERFISRSKSARIRRRATRWSLACLGLVAGGIFWWTTTSMRGGMSDLEARGLETWLRSPSGDELEQRDRMLSRVALASRDARSRLLSGWFHQPDLATPANDQATVLRAIVGLDDGLLQQARKEMSLAGETDELGWLRVRVLTSPWMGTPATIEQLLKALLLKTPFGQSHDSDVDILASRLTAVLVAAPDADLDAAFAQSLASLKLADEGGQYRAARGIVGAWRDSLAQRKAAPPGAVLQALNRSLKEVQIDGDWVLAMRLALAGSMLRHGGLAADEATDFVRRLGGKDLDAPQIDSLLSALTLDDGAATTANAKGRETRRQEILLAVAQDLVESEGFQSGRLHGTQRRQRERSEERIRALIDLAMALDEDGAGKLLTHLWKARGGNAYLGAGADDDLVDILMLRAGPRFSPRNVGAGISRTRDAPASLWTADSLSRDLKAFASELRQSDLVRLQARASHFNDTQAVHAGRSLHAALLSAVDRDRIGLLRDAIERVLHACRPGPRQQFAQSVIDPGVMRDPYSVARIAAGFNRGSHALLGADEGKALHGLVARALEQTTELYEEAALSLALEEWPERISQQLQNDRGALRPRLRDVFYDSDRTGQPTLARHRLRMAAAVASKLEGPAAADIVKAHVEQMSEMTDADDRRAWAKHLGSFTRRLNKAAATAVVDAFDERSRLASVREMRIWMETVQPVLTSIDMTEVRAARWVALSRLPMADHELIANALRPLAKTSLHAASAIDTLKALGAQLGVKPNADADLRGLLDNDAKAPSSPSVAASQPANPASGGQGAGRSREAVGTAETNVTRRQRLLVQDPFDLDALRSWMIELNKLSHVLEEVGDPNGALRAAQVEFSVNRWRSGALIDSTSALRDFTVSHSQLVSYYLAVDELDKAIEAAAGHRAVAAELLKRSPNGDDALFQPVQYFANMANIEAKRGNLSAVLTMRQQGLALARTEAIRHGGDPPRQKRWLVRLIGLTNHATFAEFAIGGWTAVLPQTKRNAELADKLLKDEADDDYLLAASRDAHHQFGIALERAGRWEQALREYANAITLAQRMNKSDAASHRAIISLSRAARVRAFLGQPDQALLELAKAASQTEELLNRNPGNPDFVETLAVQFQRQGEVQTRQNRPAEAIAALNQAQAHMEQIYKSFKLGDLELGFRLVDILCSKAEAQWAGNDSVAAGKTTALALSLLEELPVSNGVQAEWNLRRSNLAYVQAQIARAAGDRAAATGSLELAQRLINELIQRWPIDVVISDAAKRIERVRAELAVASPARS